MAFAILTANRVCICTTIEQNYPLQPGQIAHPIPDGTSIAGYQVVQADGVIRNATAQEIDDADVDPVRVRAKALALRTAVTNALTAIEAASTTAAAVTALRQFAAAQKALNAFRSN